LIRLRNAFPKLEALFEHHSIGSLPELIMRIIALLVACGLFSSSTLFAQSVNVANKSGTGEWTVSFSRLNGPLAFELDSFYPTLATAKKRAEKLIAWSQQMPPNSQWKLHTIKIEGEDSFGRPKLNRKPGDTLREYMKSISAAYARAKSAKDSLTSRLYGTTEAEFERVNGVIASYNAERSETQAATGFYFSSAPALKIVSRDQVVVLAPPAPRKQTKVQPETAAKSKDQQASNQSKSDLADTDKRTEVDSSGDYPIQWGDYPSGVRIESSEKVAYGSNGYTWFSWGRNHRDGIGIFNFRKVGNTLTFTLKAGSGYNDHHNGQYRGTITPSGDLKLQFLGDSPWTRSFSRNDPDQLWDYSIKKLN
jgi:hypothetical protein